MKKLNPDQATRDKMLDVHYYSFDAYGTFNDLDAATLQKLVDLNFADPADKQNEAPTLQEFLDFMHKYPEYRAHGYVISYPREDYRVSIEGLEGIPASIDSRSAFMQKFSNADELSLEFSTGKARCWYD